MGQNGYGIWGMADLWVMVSKSLRTELVDSDFYGVWEVMGYTRYGLRGVRLYTNGLLLVSCG